MSHRREGVAKNRNLSLPSGDMLCDNSLSTKLAMDSDDTRQRKLFEGPYVVKELALHLRDNLFFSLSSLSRCRGQRKIFRRLQF
jgi:hypothetical protein